jgi:hypothetical protein
MDELSTTPSMNDPTEDVDATTSGESTDDTSNPRRWKKSGWIANVVKNLDDDGWAVEMIQIGAEEPALVGPWTMGRDKKNPKPLDQPSFMTLVKTANEILLRHAQSARARLHKSTSFEVGRADAAVFEADGFEGALKVRADLDIAQDDDDPHAVLSVFEDTTSTELRRGRVRPDFKLSAASVTAWMKRRDSGE